MARGPTQPALTAPIVFESLETRLCLSHAPVVVHAGESIQAAVDAAAPGTDILIEPGLYSQSVVVAKADIHVIGRTGGGGVTIQNPGGVDNGIFANVAAAGFALQNVTVQGFGENGVLLVGVDGFEIDNVIAQNNHAYGLFPVHCSNGDIDHCVASGQSDTGIYLGQSHDVTIEHCTAFGNVEGITVENSSHVDVAHNLAFDNVAGISAMLLPLLSVKTSSDITIEHNTVLNNNHMNFGDSDDPESFLPSGIGVLVLGVDNGHVSHNIVAGNQFVGIALASSLLFGQFAGIPPIFFSDIEPSPDNNTIDHNVLAGNGTQPIPVFGGADLLWDGSGTDNHWEHNVFATSIPSVLP
jgi:parallel beta-helix repeat protein